MMLAVFAKSVDTVVAIANMQCNNYVTLYVYKVLDTPLPTPQPVYIPTLLHKLKATVQQNLDKDDTEEFLQVPASHLIDAVVTG